MILRHSGSITKVLWRDPRGIPKGTPGGSSDCPNGTLEGSRDWDPKGILEGSWRHSQRHFRGISRAHLRVHPAGTSEASRNKVPKEFLSDITGILEVSQRHDEGILEVFTKAF